MSEDKAQIYRYRSPFLAMVYVVTAIGIGFFAAGPLIMVALSRNSAAASIPFVVYVVFELLSLASIAAMINALYDYSPHNGR